MSRLSALVEIIAAKPTLSRKDLARRYGKDDGTIDRWHADGTLPAARYLRGCPFPFWTPAEIEANEHHNPKLVRDAKSGAWRRTKKVFPNGNNSKRVGSSIKKTAQARNQKSEASTKTTTK